MTGLEELLARVPAVYAELEHAATPGRTGEPSDRSPDPREKPAPGRLDVIDHRHLLIRGLRWWVDAVCEFRPANAVGDSPARMCALILHELPNMAPEDRESLHANLWEWLGGALPLVGRVFAPTPPRLPMASLDAVVPVHVAAEVLGVSVSTVKRRASREGGQVRLREAAGALCERSDLPEPWCAHCRPTAQ